MILTKSCFSTRKSALEIKIYWNEAIWICQGQYERIVYDFEVKKQSVESKENVRVFDQMKAKKLRRIEKKMSGYLIKWKPKKQSVESKENVQVFDQVKAKKESISRIENVRIFDEVKAKNNM